MPVALADIGGGWSVDRVTRTLSEFADACVKGALRFLLRRAGGETASEETTGLVVLAMGKYGAFELNYSSDIDLVVFYDAERFPLRKRDDARGAAVDIVKGLVKLLSEQTADGYVFRVDLRLRPDAGATQVAISTEAAEAYYEGMGQNWERAAMIKARACAGDPTAAARFLRAVEPFVWRRNLDFAAIEDIHSIKRQIHAHEGHGRITVAGHNVKLGRGGIREIEFFAQTQQLILGGRKPALRAPATLDALAALHGEGLIGGVALAELSDSYRYLRKLEHRLQMIEDQQTHTLPKSRDELDHVACFMGAADFESFATELTHRLETVQDHYVRLFEREAPLAGDRGNLVFTGVEDDPETLATLGAMGFRDTHHVANAIRGWHHGRIRATRSARARELLTKLVPALLAALAASADPDAAFMQFDRFVSNLPAGVQLFSLFLARPERCFGWWRRSRAPPPGSPRIWRSRRRRSTRCWMRISSRTFRGAPSSTRRCAICSRARPITRPSSTRRGASRASRSSASACRSSKAWRRPKRRARRSPTSPKASSRPCSRRPKPRPPPACRADASPSSRWASSAGAR